jgi:riboflavin kinase/FMN adenylyltransferase
LSNLKKSVIALGTFDGVHLGHQKIIAALLEEAHAFDLKPIIVTFFPHPTHILTPDKPLKLINSIDERIELLKFQGVEHVVVKEFTEEFSKKSALEFIREELLQKLQMKTLIVGYDHSFGKNKGGNYKTLSSYGSTNGFDVKRVLALNKEGSIISSSLIRDLLLEGEIKKVNSFLDYTFCLFGTVVKGNQLGRKIGFHTANIVLDYPNKIVPKKGVYIVQSEIESKNYYGMMNIGFRPTINGKTQTIEVHYFNLDKNLYNSKVRVKLLSRLRDEFKFDSIEDLKDQLLLDKKNALEYLKSI